MNRSEKRRQQKSAKKAAKMAKSVQLANSSLTHQTLNLAMQHHNAGRLPEAESIYQKILQADPNQPVALHLLGVIAQQVGKNDIAVDLITKALAIKPDYADAHYNLGFSLHKLWKHDEAVASYNKAIAIKPEFAEAHYNLGNVLKDLWKLDEAVVSYNKALAIKPDLIEPHNNMGIALHKLGKFDDAVISYHKALAIKPDYAEAHSNMGNALAVLGKHDEAVESYNKAIAIKPDYAEAHSNLVVTIPFLSNFNIADVFAITRRAGMALEEPFVGRPSPHHANNPDPNRPLNVGYLSPSLNTHVLSHYLEPVFKFHRRDRVSVHVYAHVPIPDDVTWKLKKLVDRWTFVHTLSDDQVAAKIIEDGIDILVDPMGHWNSNRLSVFARKPAPIQVSYLCQNLTSGLSTMDYIIGDRWLNEGGVMQNFSTEQVVELEGGFQTTSFDNETPIGEVPSMAAGFINFASFNNPSKISNKSLCLWARILSLLPSARLLIKGKWLDSPEKRMILSERLEYHGIPAKRVNLRGFIEGSEHLAIYNEVDIALDSTPFTGGRTTVDALWMGVPVVTLIGEAVYGRYSYCILNRVGAPELAARSEEEFVEIAVNLAGDVARLKNYRNSLRSALKASSLLDSSPHVVELEEAYRTMWRRWCAGMEPKAFTISSIKKV